MENKYTIRKIFAMLFLISTVFVVAKSARAAYTCPINGNSFPDQGTCNANCQSCTTPSIGPADISGSLGGGSGFASMTGSGNVIWDSEGIANLTFPPSVTLSGFIPASPLMDPTNGTCYGHHLYGRGDRIDGYEWFRGGLGDSSYDGAYLGTIMVSGATVSGDMFPMGCNDGEGIVQAFSRSEMARYNGYSGWVWKPSFPSIGDNQVLSVCSYSGCGGACYLAKASESLSTSTSIFNINLAPVCTPQACFSTCTDNSCQNSTYTCNSCWNGCSWVRGVIPPSWGPWSPDPSTICSSQTASRSDSCGIVQNTPGTKPSNNCQNLIYTCNSCWNGCSWIQGVIPINSCENYICNTDSCWNGCSWARGIKICSCTPTDPGCSANTCIGSECNDGCTYIDGTKPSSKGICGSAANQSWGSKPNSDLCSTPPGSPAPNPVKSGTNWTWNCSGICGGSSTPCTAKVDTNWIEVAP